MKNSLEIHFLGHATLLLKVDFLNIIFDPHLNHTYRHGLFGYHPQRIIKKKEIAKLVDVVIISHSHRDHFDVVSLDNFSKHTTFFIPNDRRIQYALKLLGFTEVFVLSDWANFFLSRDLQITVTPSTYRVPEHGFLIKFNSISIWNVVDSHVTNAWCRKVIELNEGCNIDYVFLPTQPLIEGNSTSGIAPYATRARIQETAELVDIVRPSFVIPFADGHFCIGRSAWLNRHWMPFDQLQKYEAIDNASYKPQILECDSGDSLVIKVNNRVIHHRITESPFAFREDNINRPNFDPSYSMDPATSYKDIPLEEAHKCLLLLLSKENLAKLSNNINKWHIRSEPILYTFTLLNRNAQIVLRESVSWNGEMWVEDLPNLMARYEIVCGIAEFMDLFFSKMEFSAALIGGFLRETRIGNEISQELHVLRSLADLTCEHEFWSISGIFILNQLLLFERDRSVLELENAINRDSLPYIRTINAESIWSQIYKIGISPGRFDDDVGTLVEEFILNRTPLQLWSGVREFNGHKVFVGFIDNTEWSIPKDVECVLVPVNLVGPQSIYGCGVGSSRRFASSFLRNIERFSNNSWNICLGFLKNITIPLWRASDLFPIETKEIYNFLSSSKKSESCTVISSVIPWWLGYPPPTYSNQEYCLTINRESSFPIFGAVNTSHMDKLVFKNQQAFIAHVGTLRRPLIFDLIQGHIRISWILSEDKWSKHGIQNWKEVTDIIIKIVSELVANNGENDYAQDSQ